ncbi:thiol-disulfide isomerase/thioredoxin [Actinokineospora baliensis]|uniref:TlpA family protein disulfide reductase n=1 Tax=Actinokineospora baliensis TaxID=547056 RepID=UPI001958815B|nr:TlpA family protein disulfide reductase [Actinokineospora baliensis]MBM7772262.1 thiol-disulfide isomerase/thioredoxin [Actinokineospora baliensis]
MSVTIAITVLVGVLGVLNLFLTVGVIRRLRQQSEVAVANRPAPPEVMVPNGTAVGEFTASTVDEEVVGTEMFREGPTFVGVFAHGCSSCDERLPGFLEAAQRFPGGRDRVFALVIGASEDVVEKRAALSPLARVVLEETPGGPVASAFKTKGYPAFAVVDTEGVVQASGTLIEHALRAPVRA